jgi:hypothetical protein
LEESINEKINIKYSKTTENFNPKKEKSKIENNTYDNSEYIIGKVESKMNEINENLEKKYNKLKQNNSNNINNTNTYLNTYSNLKDIENLNLNEFKIIEAKHLKKNKYQYDNLNYEIANDLQDKDYDYDRIKETIYSNRSDK